MKEKQVPSQSGLAAAATSKRSSRGVAAGNHSASEVPGSVLPLILLWPPDPEGWMCNLKFTHILPGRKDSDGSKELHSLQACPLIQVFNWGSEYTSALFFWLSAWCSCSFYLLLLPQLPLLVTLCCPDCMCESNTAAAMPVPTSC